MNWDIVKGNAKQLKGEMKAKWGKLTDDDLTLLDGKADDFFGRLQERVGLARENAEVEIDGMLKKFSGKQPVPKTDIPKD